MAPDYDALSDGSDLTGEDESFSDEVMPSATHTPSKKRRRAAAPKVIRDDDDEEDEEDEDEVADALEDDFDEEEDADELDEDEEDEEYDAPSSSRKATRASGRKSARTTARSSPQRGGRASKRNAATATGAPAATPATPASGRKTLRVKLTRTPQSAAPKADSPPLAASAVRDGRPSRAAAASAATPPTRRAKESTKASGTSRGKAKLTLSSDEEDSIRTPDDDELDDLDADTSRAPTADPASDSNPDSNDDGSASEPDEAAAAEMAAIMGKTARQLARETGAADTEHMELPMFDPNRKKKLTESELALRRSETARKRKNQVEKKLEDDKVETINRLLKKQVGRSRNKLRAGSAGEESDEEKEKERKKGKEEVSRKEMKEMPAPFFRYVDRVEGKILAVPSGPRLVEEVWGPNYVEVNTALIQELETPLNTQGLDEKAKTREERARKRLEEQAKGWKEEQGLEQVWGQEGLYEYKLRAAFGQSRKDWLGSRPAPAAKEKESPAAQEAEHQEAAQAGEAQDEGMTADEGEGEKQEE